MQEKRLVKLVEEQLHATHELVKIPKSESISEATEELVRAFQHRIILLSEACIERDLDPEIREMAASVAQLSRELMALKEKEFGTLWAYLRGSGLSDDGPFFKGMPDEGPGYDGGAPVPARLIPKPPPRRSGSDAKALPVDEQMLDCNRL
jgi:hypothetical protein